MAAKERACSGFSVAFEYYARSVTEIRTVISATDLARTQTHTCTHAIFERN